MTHHDAFTSMHVNIVVMVKYVVACVYAIPSDLRVYSVHICCEASCADCC